MPTKDHISSLIKGVSAGTTIGCAVQSQVEQFMAVAAHPDIGFLEGFSAAFTASNRATLLAAVAGTVYFATRKMPGWKPNTFLAAVVPSTLGAAFLLAVTATPVPPPIEALTPAILPAEPQGGIQPR